MNVNGENNKSFIEKKMSFKEYCNKNILYIIVVFIISIAIYGAWAFQYFVSFDAEGFFKNVSGIVQNGWYKQWIRLGRWGFVVLKKLLNVVQINPFFSIGIFLSFFPLSSIIWNYTFEKFGITPKTFIGKIIFNFIFISHPIWALQFAYRNQIEVLSIISVLTPITVNGLIYFVENKLNKETLLIGILSLFGAIFCFAGYQSFVVLYIVVIAIYFFIKIFYGSISIKEFYRRFVMCVCFFIIAFISYLISMKVFCAFINVSVVSSYFESQFLWLSQDFTSCVVSLFSYLKIAFIGDNVAYTGIFLIEFIIGIFIYIYNIKYQNTVVQKIYTGIIYVSLFILPLILTIFTAGIAVHRQQFAYIFTIAFMGYFEFNYLVENIKLFNNKFIYNIIAVLMCYVGLLQMQLNTRLLYSDYYTMQNDYLMMNEIYSMSLDKGAKPGDAIVFIGSYTNNNQSEVIREYEVIGYSYFEVIPAADTKTVEAMIAYGFDVSIPTEEQKEYAKSIKDSLNIYPEDGYIYVEDGLIIVRLD